MDSRKHVTNPIREPSPGALDHSERFYLGDEVLWHQEGGPPMPARVVQAPPWDVGSRGQRVRIIREEYVWASELVLDSVRGMSPQRLAVEAARLGDLPPFKSRPKLRKAKP